MKPRGGLTLIELIALVLVHATLVAALFHQVDRMQAEGLRPEHVESGGHRSSGEGQNVFYNDGHVKWGATPGRFPLALFEWRRVLEYEPSAAGYDTSVRELCETCPR